MVFFSDATVAIALTLLVLPLTDVASQASHVAVGKLISDHRSAIVAFAISFVVIGFIWLEHHHLFESLVDYDGVLVRINLVWLFAVVSLPFSTQAQEQALSGDRGALALYIGNLLLSFVAIALMRLDALRDPKLIDPARRADFGVGSSLVLVVLCAVALIVAISAPRVGMWALLLLAPAGTVSRLLRRARRSR